MNRAEFIPTLVEIAGRRPGREHPLPFGEHTLGRDSGISIQLDHPDISRRHARLDVSSECVSIEDLGSKNGVWVAGVPIDQPRSLGDGDRVEMGDVILELRHPGLRMSRLLLEHGEATVTRRFATAHPVEIEPRRGLLLPIAGVVVFAALLFALVMWG